MLARLRLNLMGAGEDEVEGRFGLRRFTRSAGILSLSSVANFLRAVVTAKLFAVTLGPSAVGILAQLFNFSALAAAILPLGLTTGVAKVVAEGARDERKVSQVIVASTVISLAAGLAAVVILVPLSPQISAGLTGSSRYGPAVLLMVLSFPLYNVAGALGYVLQGLSEIRRLTRANILTAAFALVTLIPLTIAYGLTGAIAATLVTSVTQTVIFGVETWRAYGARMWTLTARAFSRPLAKELLLYGGVLLVASILNWSSVLAVRTLTVRMLGGTANGLYQVVFGLSTQYITIFMTWMGAYVFPRVVAESRSGKLARLLNSGLRANLALMVPILVLSIALREPLIRIFYSQGFVAAAPYIPIQVIGDYLRIVGWSFAVCLFAIGRTRSYLLLMTAQSLVWVAAAAASIPVWGLWAVPASYSISFLTYPVIGIVLARYRAGVAPDRTALALAGVGLLCVLGSLAPFYAGILLAPAMPAIVYVLNRNELRSTSPRAQPSRDV